MNTAKKPVAGDLIHFRSSMSVALGSSNGRVFHRGEELELTADIIESAKDRNGNSWLDLDPGEQVQRYGKQIWGIGPVPADIEWWNAPGDTASRDVAKIRARDIAAKISDPTEREAAWAAARKNFGGTDATSWSTQS